jgi:outer membrane murein-binding lipoprotein Lpp
MGAMGAMSKLINSGAIQRVVKPAVEAKKDQVSSAVEAKKDQMEPFRSRRRGQAANILASEADGARTSQKRLLGE